MAVAAVGMDGALATYTNAGTNISVSAPGGDFRLDDNGGGGVIGPGWDFEFGQPQFMIGYGTSASAPFVSGIAALLLSQNPSLTAAQLRSRIEQFATRPAGSSRSDSFGWGIVNAYNALTQTTGPARQASARLIDATTGAVARTTTVNADGSFAFAKLTGGSSYYLQAGEDESGRRTDRRARTALHRRRRTRSRDGVQRRRRRTVGCPRARAALRVRAERRRRSTPICSRSEATSSARSRRPTCTTSIA